MVDKWSHEERLFQVLAKVKTWNSYIKTNFLYYIFIRICSHLPHIAFSKANGLVAAAPLTPNWPGPSLLLDIPNLNDDIFLKRHSANTFIGSSFAKSEPYAWRIVFLLMLWTHVLYHILMPSPAHSHPSGIKNVNNSIVSTTSIHQTAFDICPNVPLETADRVRQMLISYVAWTI